MPPPTSPPSISLCVLRGLESRGKPSFPEPYLSRSLPSCKHTNNASRHIEINIISNLPCIFSTLYLNISFTYLLPVEHLQICLLSKQRERGCSLQWGAAQTLLTVVAFKIRFKCRSWVEHGIYSWNKLFSHNDLYCREILIESIMWQFIQKHSTNNSKCRSSHWHKHSINHL